MAVGERQMGEVSAGDTSAVERGNPKTREMLLDAAEQLLAGKSINDITVNDIAIEAGVSIGTFYNYFRDRYDILKGLVRRRTERIFDDAHEHIPSHLGTLERLEFSILKILRSWQQYSGVLRSLYQLSVQRPDFVALHRQLREPFARRISAGLEASIARGHAPPIDTSVAVDALSTMLSWSCMTWIGLGQAPYPGATLEELASQVALLWYRAIFARDPAEASEHPAMVVEVIAGPSANVH